MKKTIALLLMTAMIICLVTGCGKKKTETNNNSAVLWENASGDSVFTGAVQGESSAKPNSSNGNQGSSSTQNSNSQGGSSTGSTSSGGLGNIEIQTNTSNGASSNVSSNTSSNVSSEEEEKIVDISGSGITQNGVETVLSTNSLPNEFVVPAFEKLTYTHTNGKKMCYSLRLPENYDKNKKYPVLMFLHGIKQAGSNWNSLEHLASLYQYNADIVNTAIVVAPQAPSVDLWQMSNDGTGAMAYSLLTKVIEKNYSVDMNRIYLIGLSMGGMGTWGMLEEHPEHFAAASPICGSGTPSKASVLKNIPIWCWHGTADTTVGYDWDGASPKMYDAIKKAGGNKIIFTKLQGEGHNAWDPAFRSREHISWLFSQVKGKHQSTEYSMVPFLTVKDSGGNVIISEKDAIKVEVRKGTGKASGGIDLVLTLSKEATQKLSSAYQKSGGKEFKIYFGNKQIVAFKATKKTTGRILVVRDVLTGTDYNKYYSKLSTTVGRD